MNILKDSIAALSTDEQNAEQKVLTEFANLTNSQVYEHVFIHRMMLAKRNVTKIHSPSDILGTDSCELILPTLHKTLQTVLSNTADSPEFHLLDIGACSGEIIDWCFDKELKKNAQINRQNIIHIIEPNSSLLQAYQQKLCEYTHLSQGISYNGRVQDYFAINDELESEIPLPLIPLDFINCIHMINYLSFCTLSENDYNTKHPLKFLLYLLVCFSDFHCDVQHKKSVDITSPKFDPSNDIVSYCKFLYSLLKPGGAIYIAHLDVLSPFAIDDIKNDSNEEISQRIQQLVSSRNSLLYEGEIIDHLHCSELNECEVDYDSDTTETNSRGMHKRKIKTIPKFNSYKSPSSFYAKTLADMAVLLLIGQLSKIKNDEKRFDIRILENVLEQVKEAAMTLVGEGEKKRFGLERGMRSGEMVWKVDLPLIISIIRKEEIHV